MRICEDFDSKDKVDDTMNEMMIVRKVIEK